MPFMVLVRRMGRERQATLPIDEARAVMNLLYDDFESHCAPEFLENSLDLVHNRLEARAKRKNFVELLPLPTGPKDCTVSSGCGAARVLVLPRAHETRAYLESGIRETLAKNPKWLDQQLARIAAELETRPAHVYGNRDKDLTWEGLPIPPQAEATPEGDQVDAEPTEEAPLGAGLSYRPMFARVPPGCVGGSPSDLLAPGQRFTRIPST